MRHAVGGHEVQIYQGENTWFWMVYDSEGDEVASGRSPTQKEALRRAHRMAREGEGLWSLQVLCGAVADFRPWPRLRAPSKPQSRISKTP